MRVRIRQEFNGLRLKQAQDKVLQGLHAYIAVHVSHQVAVPTVLRDERGPQNALAGVAVAMPQR